MMMVLWTFSDFTQ